MRSRCDSKNNEATYIWKETNKGQHLAYRKNKIFLIFRSYSEDLVVDKMYNEFDLRTRFIYL
jgi:hypothetical protein